MDRTRFAGDRRLAARGRHITLTNSHGTDALIGIPPGSRNAFADCEIPKEQTEQISQGGLQFGVILALRNSPRSCL
jgi:hypothetical protein